MVTRVGGLASGMDIDSLVEKLMNAERAPLNKLKQQKTTYEWQRDAYRGVNTKLKTFDTYVFDNLRLSSSLAKKIASVSDSSKVSVTAGSGAQGTLSIDSVSQLATAAKVSGSVANATLTQRLATENDSLQTMMGAGAPATLTFAVQGTNAGTINIDTTKSIKDVLTQLNTSGTGLTASYNSSTGKFSFSTTTGNTVDFNDPTSKADLTAFGMDTTKTSGTFTSSTKWIAGNTSTASSSTKLGEFGIGDGKFTISAPNTSGTTTSKEISFSATDTMDSLLTKINSAGVGATALIGSNGKISITANNTGTGSIGLTNFTGTNSATLEKILADSNNDGSVNATDFTAGQNATFTVNGVQMTSRNNSTTVSGYNITLNQTFAPGSPVTIGSSTDTQSMVDKIKEFVNTYNGLIADLGAQTKEAKYRDYKPLTDEQKKDMSENEVKLWEEKAKSGLLRNDSIIRDGLFKLRSQFTDRVSGLGDSTMDSLAELGISTSSKISDGGKLVINETKLRAAIEKNPDQVISVFTQTGEKTTSVVGGKTQTVDSRGIAQRLRESLDDMMGNIEGKAGKTTNTDYQYTIGKNLITINSRIDRLQDRLTDVEKRYWRQFTAMEQAINKGNAQSSIFGQSG